jgi:hypothetical protein
MDRPTRRKARLALAIVATLIVLPVPAATAAAPADDEYVLQFPGVSQTDSNVNQAPAHAGGGSGIQRGVVGEADVPPTPLAAAGDALAGFPVSLLIGAALLLVTAIGAAGVRRHRPPSTC